MRAACIRSTRSNGSLLGSMTESVPPPPLLPESALFSPEQRAWLNGFFAGFLALDSNGITALSPEHADALLSGITPLAKETSDDDVGDAPWHDPAMPLPDRMKLAEGRSMHARLMAAMGQQDCGQCGYNCRDYSSAIFLRKEVGKQALSMVSVEPVRAVEAAIGLRV